MRPTEVSYDIPPEFDGKLKDYLKGLLVEGEPSEAYRRTMLLAAFRLCLYLGTVGSPSMGVVGRHVEALIRMPEAPATMDTETMIGRLTYLLMSPSCAQDPELKALLLGESQDMVRNYEKAMLAAPEADGSHGTKH